MNCYEVTERFVLHAGYSCNERCEFCYYLKDIVNGTARDFSTEKNKKRIKFAYKIGKRAIDISGGEPTIRKDLPELINFCRKTGYETINIITNGIITSNIDYCKTLKTSGLTEGLFSIHSHDASIHDALTRVKGSHQKVIASLENFKKLNLQRRINTVITNKNFREIESFLKLIYEWQPMTVNLIVFNPSETAVNIKKEGTVRFSDYQVIGDAISSALDKWKEKFNIINVRFLPFCFLKKHPDVIRTQWQKFHEDQEWDPFLNVSFQKGYLKACASFLAGFFCSKNTPKFTYKRFDTFLCKYLSNFRMRHSYRQNDICGECDLSPICTGIQRDYVKKFGFPGFESIKSKGEKVVDPLFFVKQQRYRQIFKGLR